MIKCFIFDLNKVVVDEDFFNLKKDYNDLLLEKLGVNSEEFIKGFKIFSKKMGLGELDENDFWNKVLNQINANKNIDFCKKFIRNIFYENKKVTDLLKKLKDKGYYLVLLSGDSKYFTDFKVEQFGLNYYFNKIFSTGELRIDKDDEKIYSLILEKMGFKPNNCVFIDDLDKHLNPAYNIGLNILKFDEDFFEKINYYL